MWQLFSLDISYLSILSQSSLAKMIDPQVVDGWNWKSKHGPKTAVTGRQLLSSFRKLVFQRWMIQRLPELRMSVSSGSELSSQDGDLRNNPLRGATKNAFKKGTGHEISSCRRKKALVLSVPWRWSNSRLGRSGSTSVHVYLPECKFHWFLVGFWFSNWKPEAYSVGISCCVVPSLDATAMERTPTAMMASDFFQV